MVAGTGRENRSTGTPMQGDWDWVLRPGIANTGGQQGGALRWHHAELNCAHRRLTRHHRIDVRRHPARESKSDYGRRMLAWSAASVPAYTVRSTMQPANRAGNRLPIGRGRRRCCPARGETILARAIAAALRAARSGLEASNAAVTCGAAAEFTLQRCRGHQPHPNSPSN